MLKKVFSLANILIFICMLCTNTFAFDNNSIKSINKSLNVEILDDDSEKDAIVNAIKGNLNDQNSEKTNWDEDSNELGEYYKIYWVRDNLKKYSNIDDAFENSVVMWEYLVKDSDSKANSAIRAVKSNDSWHVSTGFQQRKEFDDFYANPQHLANILNNEKIIPELVKHARIKELYLDFYYIEENNKAYVIPFTHLYKEYNIENYKVYQANDFLNIIKKQYVDPSAQINDNQSQRFGGNNKNYLESNWAIGITIFGMLVIFFGIVYMCKRNKNRTEFIVRSDKNNR